MGNWAKNILFGGEGLFLASLTGPGHVWLQSMPIMNLAEEISRYIPRTAESSSNAVASASAVGIAGGLLGGLFGGASSDNDSST